jgi:deoxyribonuclease-4
MWLGAHVPTTGGLHNAPMHGAMIRAEAIQIFTRNQRQWRVKPVGPREARDFREAMQRSGIRLAVAHASYLLNLASPDSTLNRRSRRSLAREIRRCADLGIPLLVLHPGSHMGAGLMVGISRVADGIDWALGRTANDDSVKLLVESTAGQGSSVGGSFEHLAEVLKRSRYGRRVGVCLDTCHLHAAGYDLASSRGYEETWRAFDRALDRSRLGLIHLNDANGRLGSRRDRHAGIGKGALGLSAFRRLMIDPRLQNVPMILETPGGLPVWRRELTALRRLVKGRRPPRRNARK